jgi:osmotically inducible protein OsmC
MTIRNADATWEGNQREGGGVVKAGSGNFELPFTYASRFEEDAGTNPEELLGAAHAACYTMALSGGLGRAGFPSKHIHTSAKVHLGRVDGKARILKIELECEAEAPGISSEQFLEIAEATKTGCPISAALAAVEITLNASLI